MNSTSNIKIDGKYNINNDKDIETEILEYLAAKGAARPKQIKAALGARHRKDRGYSEENLNRKFSNMRKSGILVSLKHDELQKYGIQNTDRRASYLIPKRNLKMKEDLDKTFSLLDSADVKIKKLILKEIARSEKKYVLDPYQLDILAKYLDAEDDEVVDSLLKILFRYITEKGIEPLNKDKFLEILRSTLKQYKVSPDEYPLLRRHITWLLGYYRDSFVIDQLKVDAESLEDLSSVKCDYCNPLIAPFIEEHSLELLNFQIELKLQEKERSSEIISEIKDEASNPKPNLKGF